MSQYSDATKVPKQQWLQSNGTMAEYHRQPTSRSEPPLPSSQVTASSTMYGLTKLQTLRAKIYIYHHMMKYYASYNQLTVASDLDQQVTLLPGETADSPKYKRAQYERQKRLRYFQGVLDKHKKKLKSSTNYKKFRNNKTEDRLDAQEEVDEAIANSVMVFAAGGWGWTKDTIDKRWRNIWRGKEQRYANAKKGPRNAKEREKEKESSYYAKKGLNSRREWLERSERFIVKGGRRNRDTEQDKLEGETDECERLPSLFGGLRTTGKAKASPATMRRYDRSSRANRLRCPFRTILEQEQGNDSEGFAEQSSSTFADRSNSCSSSEESVSKDEQKCGCTDARKAVYCKGIAKLITVAKPYASVVSHATAEGSFC